MIPRWGWLIISVCSFWVLCTVVILIYVLRGFGSSGRDDLLRRRR